jgi:hypothetical protein
MGRILFSKAGEFLASQLQSSNGSRRVGVVVRAAFSNAANVATDIDHALQDAWNKLDQAMERKLADLSDENQRAALQLRYAADLRLPLDKQLELLERGMYSETVTSAAAHQPGVACEIQDFLLAHCYHHKNAMAGLARNPSTMLDVLQQLAHYPDKYVQLTLATQFAPSMRIVDESRETGKRAVYNALLDNYWSDLAPHLVPVCRDTEQLDAMYARTAKTPSGLRHFVENPWTSPTTLLDISSSMSLRMLPGGLSVATEAKQLLEKRLVVDDDALLSP